MEKTSELLIRSALHDLANVLAGVRGILDLTAPGDPLSQRNRSRLEAVIEEGVTTLDRCRQLSMATFPDDPLELGDVWRERLLEGLLPTGTLFHCCFEVALEAAPECDQWPGDLLRSYVQAITRQVLPYAKTGTMSIQCSANPEQWRIRWSPASLIPESLGSDQTGKQANICARWTAWIGSILGATVALEPGTSATDGALLVSIPRIRPPGPVW